jgi:DNA-binding transcriptional ArsR family regulator
MHAFDVLGNPVRRRILELLAEGAHASGTIVEMVQREFDISQPAVSQHLRVLRESGFATVRVDGPRRIYEVSALPLAEIDSWLLRFRTCGRSDSTRCRPRWRGGSGRAARSVECETFFATRDRYRWFSV